MGNYIFRAWDIKNQKMLYPDGVCGPYRQPNTELICELLADFINEEEGGDELTEDFILMQYTGNENKNKKRIFAGDVLKIQLPVGGFWGKTKTEKIGVVRYEPEYGGFIVEWEYSKNQHHILLTCDIAWDCEIVGHKYTYTLHWSIR